MSSLKNKKLPVIITATVVFAAAVAGGYFFQVFRNQSNQETPDSEIPNSSITKVEDNGEEKGSVDASLKYAGYVTLLKDKNIITLNFTNPSKSKKSLKLDIVANIDGKDVTLAKTDVIRPGYKIDQVKYELGQEIPEGKYDGKFIVYFYNDQGNEEIVNSEIAINVYVK